MKKITFMVFMFLMSWCGYAQLPLENFGTTGNALPTDWQRKNVLGAAQQWVIATHAIPQTPAFGGSGQVAYINRENVSTGTTEDWLITKKFTVPADGQLRFQSRLTQLGDDLSTYRIMMLVGDLADPQDTGSYTEVIAWTELTLNPDPFQTDYLEKVVPMPASSIGQPVRLAFVMNGDNGDRWLVDNVSVLPQCFTPVGLPTTFIGTNTATLNWTNPSGATVWEIDIVPLAGAPTQVGLPHTGAPVYVATTDSAGNPLQPATQYKYYVRGICDGGIPSNWAGPFNFTTVVPGTNCTAPIVIPGNTYSQTSNTNLYGDDIEGTPGATGCGTTSTTFLNGDEVVYTYTPTYTGNAGFSMTNNGANSGMFIYTSCASIGVNCISGGTGNATTPVNLIVPVTAGTTYYVVISTSGTTQSTPYTLTVQQVNCASPVGLPTTGAVANSANLSWTNPSGATSWQVVTQIAGTGIPAGSGTTATTNTNWPATGLTESTNYEYYVRADCGDGTFSAWAGPYTFSTTQVPVTLSPGYTQNFDGPTHGFSLSNGTQTNKWMVGSATFNSAGNSLYISNDNAAYNYDINAASVVHAYRDIQLPAAVDQVNLSFDWKSVGENCCDFLRVWVVPATFTPAQGTQITPAADRIQLGGNMNSQPNWLTANFTLNAAPFAGTVRRLVFEWRNDPSIGPNPPAAVDNINISLVTCSTPTAVVQTTATDSSITFNWTGISGTATYDYYLSTSNTPPTAGTPPTGNVNTNTVTINSLTATTNYFFWVRSNCGATDGTSLWVGPVNASTTQILAGMDFSDNFDDAVNNWTLVNGTQPNKWVIGTATFNSPGKSLYITDGDGTNYNYNINAASTVQAYRDIQMPAALDQMTLSFTWKGVAENCCDFLKVWIVPTNFTPTAGTLITAAADRIQIGANLNGQANWTTANYTINGGAWAGTARRLVFEWRNDPSIGPNPPAAVDNVSLQLLTCPAPTALVLGAVGQTSATINWTGPTSVTPTFDYVFGTTNTAPTQTTVPTGNVTPATITFNSLTPSTTYYYWVRSNCGPGSTSVWVGPLSFTTTQIPDTMNFTETFDDPTSEWTLVNGTQPNKWFIGTATFNSPGKSLYITDNDGVNYNYNINAQSTVQAYRDITMPAGLDQLSLSFTWKGVAENCCDFIKVWIVPTTFTPTAGTLITPAADRIQIGANLNGQANWTTANYTINGAAYSGTTQRLVFEWRNDGSIGPNPPGAIDNIDFRILTCPAPTALVLADLQNDEATINWTGPTSVTPTFDYYFSTTNTSPVAATVPTGNVTPATANIPSLLPSTQYYFWVRSNCGGGDTSVWVGPLAFITPQIPADLNYNQDFEDPIHLWSLSNGTQTNKWIVGDATSLSPTHSLYITDNAPAYNYNINAASTVHAYRDLSIPLGTGEIEVAFDWKGVAENCCDFLRVWMVPVTFTPVPGTQITAAADRVQLGGNMNNSAAWTHANFVVNTNDFDGQIRRLVFEWRNDGSGGPNPPAAVDNVNVTIVLCPQPDDLNVNCVSSTEANISWQPGGTETTWEYAILPAGSTAPASGTETDTPGFIAEDLTLATSYTVYVRAVCGGTAGYSSWAQSDFTTTDVSIVEAEPFCADDGALQFANVFGQGANSGYGQVACLGSTPNPVWYYLQVEDDGQLDFQLIQNTQFDANGNPTGQGLDVDFAAFGPFTSLTEACAQIELVDCPTCPNNTGNANFYPFGNIVDCSFDAAFIENFTVANAQQGEIYAVLITNFNGAQGQIQLQQLDSSTGSTNCDILYDVALGPDKVLCGVPSTTVTATVTTPGNSQPPTYEWFMDDSTTPFIPTVVSTTALTQTIQITEPGYHTYTVVIEVENSANTEPITDTVIIALGPEVNVPNPAEVILCGDDGITEIDLTTLNAAILGTLLPAEYEVSYYLTEADATNGTSPIDLTVPFETSTTVIYVRINNIEVDTCFDVVPLTITVNETADAAISYADSPYCTNSGTGAVTQTGDTGGTYTSTTGLTIDAATGTITPASSTAGTYTVTYTIAATDVCPEFSTTASVVIEAAPDATIAYDGTPYCSGAGTATVTQTGTTGGTYTSTTGLVIDPATGTIDLAASTAGTYTVTYTTAATAACDPLTFTTEVVLNTQFTATIAYAGTPYCSNAGTATVTRTGDAGGAYSADSAALVIDAATGAVDLAASSAGTYTVTYTIAATESCPEFTTTAIVVVEAAPEGTIAYTGTPYCSNGGTATVAQTGTTGGTYSSDAGLTIDPATGAIDLATSTVGTYTVTYTVAATTACGVFSTTTEVVISPLPVATIDYAGTPYCSDGGTATVTQTGNAGGVYSSTAGLSINNVTGDIDLAASTPGTYTVTYTIGAANGCPDVVATTSVTITKLPLATFTYEVAAVCQNAGGTQAPTFDTGAVAGTFTTDVAGLTIDPATGVVNPATSTEGTYIVTNTIAAANGCGVVTHSVTITINPAPLADFSYDATAYCQDTTNPSPIFVGAAGTFSSATGLVIDSATGVIDLAASTPGDYTVTNTIAGTVECPSVSASVEVTITSIPVVAVLQGCEGGAYMLEVTFDDDAVYTVDTADFVWTNSAGTQIGTEYKIQVTDADTYSLTVTPRDNNECSLSTTVPVENTTCDIPRGISPNNDGKNDSFDLSTLDVRNLSIFNRYGQEVYHHGNGYTDQWSGQSNGGDELPTGTYFYMIERNNGENKTGWVYINLEE